ncbi:hypothetical protein Arnit_2544 [Arcobacter nitrofigilis DSM 7299]|uniref:Uncharacterized protein n=1 Tax=Arcobacter nitrofigilis (strain ATCC 33309 / DSM 7299 / CCUG 15893 / LMG 7604 / NCTC 12251 / CI) TaxID=572480 RepID=D5V6C3_ARCNC|nr:hypothetical protein [Arcobacter nitrofigilis]ADG94193.1 hypothetical protein Arnit_2544 [Arcobacter nitrofigilis DSM 7299]
MLDTVNILYILTIFIIINRYYNIPAKYLFILLLHLSCIFLFNGFLFETTYMPDQFHYLSVAQNIRNFDFLNESNFSSGGAVYIAGLFFGFFPIPFIDSFYSIYFIYQKKQLIKKSSLCVE